MAESGHSFHINLSRLNDCYSPKAVIKGVTSAGLSVVVARDKGIDGLDATTGSILWQHPLPLRLQPGHSFAMGYCAAEGMRLKRCQKSVILYLIKQVP